MTLFDDARGGRLSVAILCVLLAACASDPVSLEVRPSVTPAVGKVVQPVAFLHGKAFREDVRTVEPYGNQYYLPLKIGEASDRALRDAYSRLFEDAREVTSIEALRALAGPKGPVVLIEPSIARLDYLNASGRVWGPYYSEIVYGFALYDASGARIVDWRITGFGEFDMNREGKERRPDFPRGETAWMSEAPRRAVEKGVGGFVTGFERVPELIRLARNLPPASANVSPAGQVTRAVAPGAQAEYPGVLSVRAEPATVPAPPKDLVKDPPRSPPVLAIRLALRATGAHRLALDPADVQWLPEAAVAAPSEPISALPGRVLSALLTGRPFGMVIGVMAPGAGMLPALFAALFSAAENERQKQELAAWTAAIERDLLVDGIVAAGTEHGGVVYFPRPPKADGGTLVIPIVDLDDALRYTVRVPLPPG